MASIALRDELLHAALELAASGREVFPLWGKTPVIANPHPKGSDERRDCKGTCGHWGHGHHDASTNPTSLRTGGVPVPRRQRRRPVPDEQFCLDTDPRAGGHERLAELILEHGPLPETRTVVSGRYDGGSHRFFNRPRGDLVTKVCDGLDVKTSSGYTLLPPSYHPDTGRQYVLIDHPVVDAPDWLIELVTAPEPVVPFDYVDCAPRSRFWSSSIADEFAETTSWAEILEPHGWRCLDADPDADGAVWLHPTHTSACSASIRYGCLFVWSTNTPFEVSEPSNPHGHTKFRAYAVLYHDGDMSAAARTLREAI